MSDQASSRILIIDNDEALSRALRIRLESLGYLCAIACSGAQGVSVYEEGAFDLVITDLNMPGGDGISLIQTIRKHSRVPIIVMTGFGNEYREQLRRLPNVSCIGKPIDGEALIDLIETDLALSPANQSV